MTLLNAWRPYGDRLAGVRFELRRGDVDGVVPPFALAEGIDLVVIANATVAIETLLRGDFTGCDSIPSGT